uniref:Putative ribonuclease p 40kda n=1 Tax=Anopheles darlingi TaxID=43151 RepID=A0A2M4CRJ7_ANODA
MLCPELWRFPQPTYSRTTLMCSSWTEGKASDKVRREIRARQFNRTVSIVLPVCQRSAVDELDRELRAATRAGSYCCLVRQCPLVELLRQEFLEAFVRRGRIFAISAVGSLETDDCVALTPDGILLLNLHQETFQRLGISDSLVTHRKDKYVVKLDLMSTSPETSGGGPRIERVRERFVTESLACDLLIRWLPPNDCSTMLGVAPELTISPASLERYLTGTRGLTVVQVPAISYKRRELSDEAIPLLSRDKDDECCTHDELLEYFGMLVLDCDTVEEEYLNEYTLDGNRIENDAATGNWHIQINGMLSPMEVESLADTLARFVINKSNHAPPESGLLWVGLHVQCHSNVPASRGDQGEKGMGWNSENAYTIIIGSDGAVICNLIVGISGKGSTKNEFQ